MNSEEISKIVLKDSTHICSAYRSISQLEKSSFWNDIKDFYGITSQQKLYCYFHKINEQPKCKICGKPLDFISFKYGFKKYCSIACNNKARVRSEESIKKWHEKYLKTISEKYNVKNVFQIPDVISKVQEERNKKITQIVEKTKKTCIEKYGVPNAMQCKSIREKVEKTNIERYGNKCSFCGTNAEKVEAFRLKRYGPSDSVQSMISKISADNISTDNKYMNYLSLNNLSVEKSNIKCNKCGNIFTYDTEHLPKCRKCNPILIDNKEQDLSEIYSYIRSLKVVCTEKDQLVLQPYTIDLWCPERKLAIIYNSVKDNSGDSLLEKNIKIANLCKEKNIGMLQLYDVYWRDYKEIIKSIIGKKLHKHTVYLEYDLCHLCEISEAVYSKFFYENSFKRYKKPSLIIGIFYKHDLVSAIPIFHTDKNYIDLIERNYVKVIHIHQLSESVSKMYGLNNFIEKQDRMYENISDFGFCIKESLPSSKIFYDSNNFNIDSGDSYIYNSGVDIYES